jgi:hypothetical protein
VAHYLVSARPRSEKLQELRQRLLRDEFRRLRPFGEALTKSLRNARLHPDGSAVWEEEDYCDPPLAQERTAVLDDYFDELSVEPVRVRQGWCRVAALSPLFPDLDRLQEMLDG